MADKIRLEIVSAEEELFSEDVEMVYAPAEMGEVGVSPKHTPLITKLKPGEVRAQISKDEMKTFYVSGGICLLYTSPSPRDATLSRMPSSA